METCLSTFVCFWETILLLHCNPDLRTQNVFWYGWRFWFFSPAQVCPLRSTCTVRQWQTRRSPCSWRRIACPNFSSSWDQWRDPTPQAGPAPPRPSWAGMAGPKAPAHTASSAAAPRRIPPPLPRTTAPGPPGTKRRRMEGFFSTLTGLAFPSRVPPGRGCGPMWLLCIPRDRRWWTGYEMLRICPR